MVQYTRRDDVLARSARVSIGIDVHKCSCHVTALVENEKVFSGAMPAEYAALKSLLARFGDCELRVAYEAGPCVKATSRAAATLGCGAPWRRTAGVSYAKTRRCERSTSASSASAAANARSWQLHVRSPDGSATSSCTGKHMSSERQRVHADLSADTSQAEPSVPSRRARYDSCGTAADYDTLRTTAPGGRRKPPASASLLSGRSGGRLSSAPRGSPIFGRRFTRQFTGRPYRKTTTIET